MVDVPSLFSRSSRDDLLRTYTQEDGAAAAIRVGLSACGPLGVLVSEFLTQFVPGQRIDRLQEFVEEMDERLKDVEEQVRQRLQTSSAYAVLMEEITVAAVRTPDAQRRRDFAEMLKTGLTKSEVELVDYETLLRLREQVNEPQMLILVYMANFWWRPAHYPPRDKFLETHSEVFDVTAPTVGSNDEEADRRWAMYQHRKHELISLGLVRDTEGVAKSSATSQLEVTTLGRMLLTAVGRYHPSTV
jgi:hypothetical protein